MAASNSPKRKHKKDLGAVPSAPPSFSRRGKSWTLFTVKNCAFISASAASTCGNSEGHGLAGVAEVSRGGGRAGRATRANATLATAFNTLPQSPSSDRCSHHLVYTRD